MNFVKIFNNSKLPTKAYKNDAGYDIYINNYIKTIGKVDFYGTGISLNINKGYFVKLYPRSSISKTDYSLANSVGIIDNGYKGEIIVALRYHGDKKLNDRKLKNSTKIAQLILEKMIVLSDDNNDLNKREKKGFGSSN
jgi:dUTP pyrophosphatase